ncbi:MAG: hypothetical protein M3409_00115 [Gemmatimonadota bacterium]|jgi:hypothetical protein|nr:hypothetical protein [Gemmatimonadota bacterium]
MIKPNVRATFGRREAEILVALAGPGGEERLREQGMDALLDDAVVARRLLQTGAVNQTPAPLVFYLLVRHALLQREIADQRLADYTTALLLEFGRAGSAERICEGDPARFTYLADILLELERARGEREFLLRAHLGNLALWMAGIFPDRVTYRVQRRGAPPLSYYDAMGAAGFRGAAATSLALQHGLGDVFIQAADQFRNLRVALNTLSDVLFFPQPRDRDERLLREIKDRFELGLP